MTNPLMEELLLLVGQKKNNRPKSNPGPTPEETAAAIAEDQNRANRGDAVRKLYPKSEFPGGVRVDGVDEDGRMLWPAKPPYSGSEGHEYSGSGKNETEQELDTVIDQMTQDKSFRVPSRDFYSNSKEQENDFETAAASRDPVKAYKALQDKHGISDEEMNDLIEAYSGM